MGAWLVLLTQTHTRCATLPSVLGPAMSSDLRHVTRTLSTDQISNKADEICDLTEVAMILNTLKSARMPWATKCHLPPIKIIAVR